MKRSDLIWTLVGLSAVVLSCYLLYHQVRTISLDEIADSLRVIPRMNWLLAGAATLGAYSALAWYDRIALAHLGKKIPWRFISLCSFTTYALAHNIGASVFSGALVRYRAYRSKGMTPQEIGILIVFCSFTFILGTLLASGCVLLLEPDLIHRVTKVTPRVSEIIGGLLLLLVALYVLGSWRQFKPLHWRKLHIEYPRLRIVARQLLAGPLELACAAAIIYFALPAEHNPGYLVVFGVFLASFSLALLSHAPGGLGVLEVTFLAAMPELPAADVLAALIVFRGFYLLLPFALSLLIVVGFEWSQWKSRRENSPTLPNPKPRQSPDN
ncbi:lysylphosphatidylglycerol synthase transmembrane domain-containing protein [Pseudomonas guineae]|uniref:lysylphosphatidylglycerol synthase transmembrane domain-containing protein n=1 Tax=Pseudomonas guineae TaxID=425504 RepID=UPI003CFDDE5B